MMWKKEKNIASYKEKSLQSVFFGGVVCGAWAGEGNGILGLLGCGGWVV